MPGALATAAHSTAPPEPAARGKERGDHARVWGVGRRRQQRHVGAAAHRHGGPRIPAIAGASHTAHLLELGRGPGRGWRAQGRHSLADNPGAQAALSRASRSPLQRGQALFAANGAPPPLGKHPLRRRALLPRQGAREDNWRVEPMVAREWTEGSAPSKTPSRSPPLGAGADGGRHSRALDRAATALPAPGALCSWLFRRL